MNKYIILSIVYFLLFGSSYATIRRVNYMGQPRSGVDYSDFNSAQTASSSGDTIQIYRNISGDVNITKRLYIMGFGYNFDQNPGLQQTNFSSPAYLSDDPSYATSGIFKFQPGSEYSIMEGMRVYDINIFTSNITLRRVWCNNGIDLIADNGAINNTKFISCIGGIYEPVRTNPTTNTKAYNCIFNDLQIINANSSASFFNCVQLAYAWQYIDFRDAAVYVSNCIFNDNSNGFTASAAIFQNCFFTNTKALPPGSSNNRFNVSYANLFQRLGGASDSPGNFGNSDFDEDYFVLKSGAQAINGGFDSNSNPTDCGIYGGELVYRYKLSGQPAAPAIYQISAPTQAANSSPYNINISVKSNN